MGCWNETDALTQLPILVGDPVKLIVISSTPDGDDELALVRCFPISGKYDDYGKIKDIKEDWATKAFLDYCNERFENKKWAFAEEEKERVKIFKVKHPFETVEDVLGAIERGFIVSKEWSDSIVPVFFVMIHDEIYAKAVEMGGKYVDYKGSYLDGLKKRIDVALHPSKDELLCGLQEFEPEVQAKFLPCRLTMMLSEKLFSVFGSINGGYIKRVYGDSCFGGAETCSAASKEEYLNYLIELACLKYFMRVTRRKFYKQTGSGSQDSEFEMAAQFLDFAKDYALKRHKEILEYD